MVLLKTLSHSADIAGIARVIESKKMQRRIGWFCVVPPRPPSTQMMDRVAFSELPHIVEHQLWLARSTKTLDRKDTGIGRVMSPIV